MFVGRSSPQPKNHAAATATRPSASRLGRNASARLMSRSRNFIRSGRPFPLPRRRQSTRLSGASSSCDRSGLRLVQLLAWTHINEADGDDEAVVGEGGGQRPKGGGPFHRPEAGGMGRGGALLPGEPG